MKHTKRNIIYALIISFLTIVIAILFFNIEKKSWKIEFAFYFSLGLTTIIWIDVFFSFIIEIGELKPYKINDFEFKPMDYDFYQDLRILFEEKNLENSQEEKELLEKYKLKTNELTRANCYYLVYKDSNPCALIKYNYNKKEKSCFFEIIKSTCDLTLEINEILKKKKKN